MQTQKGVVIETKRSGKGDAGGWVQPDSGGRAIWFCGGAYVAGDHVEFEAILKHNGQLKAHIVRKVKAEQCAAS